jgi:hypothetical protein
LPADGLAFFAQPDQALGGVEVAGSQRQGAGSAAGGLGVQAQQQAVEVGVVAGGCCDVVDRGELLVRNGPASAGEPARFGDPDRGVVGIGEQSVDDGVLEMQRSAAIWCSAAVRPPRVLRRMMPASLVRWTSWVMSIGVISSSRRGPQASRTWRQYVA